MRCRASKSAITKGRSIRRSVSIMLIVSSHAVRFFAMSCAYHPYGCGVAVGTPVTQRPPPRSRRAALPHRAPASGRDAQALRGIRMKDMGFGQPVLCDGVHAWPCHPVALTASAQRLTPIPHDGVAEYPEQAAIARDGIVSIMPQQHAFEPSPLLRDGPMHAPPQRVFHGLQFLA